MLSHSVRPRLKPGGNINQKIRNNGVGCDPGIKSINLHINATCNYRCKFCFARNLIRETMDPNQWKPYFEHLRSMGIEKINFAGGEPTLHPHFLELCSLAKELGFTVSVVTNGSTIDETEIENMIGIVDWIGLSVDSPSNDIEKELGRHCNGIDHIENIIKVSEMAHDAGIKVKLNITVVKQSWNSDFTALIDKIAPERLKAFRVTKVEGQNDDTFDECSVTQEQWDAFVSKHKGITLNNGDEMVFEGEDVMIDSYLMLDPIARSMRNTGNRQSYLPFDTLFKGLDRVIDREKYTGRGGLYKWGDDDE